eukprot:TRINITY_DN72276_c0_g1_i1.p1 TRINITY_DN72276_c0_g1~~TRINITY_DN72276_c0_g1_i1.p1  ORF type:complete len:666 (+),score=85.39 TRINITY_DN72276_c0_g1_i1:57-2054(+)
MAVDELRVTLLGISGKCLEFKFSSDVTFHAVKRHIAELWDIPPICQKLAVDCTAPRDNELLADYRASADEGQITMTLITMLSKLYTYAPLDDRDRQVAVDFLGRSALPGDTRAVDALLPRINDREASVRASAMRGLARIVTSTYGGTLKIMHGLVKRLDHEGETVRRIVVSVLKDLAQTAGKPGQDFIVDLVTHATVGSSAWSAAMRLLRDMSKTHSDGGRAAKVIQAGITELLLLLEHRDGAKRRMAVCATSHIFSGGDTCVFPALGDLLRDPADLVRSEAAQVLCRFMHQQDQIFKRQLLRYLDDQSRCREVQYRGVLVSCLKVLPCAVERGDSKVLGRFSGWFQHPAAQVRLSAVHALGQIARRRDAHVLKLLRAQLTDPDENVRVAVLQALARIAPRGDKSTVDFLLMAVSENPSATVVKVLAKVAQKNDSSATKRITPLLVHESASIRLAAVKAIAKIAARGSEIAISELLARVVDGDRRVRQAAVGAFAHLAPEKTANVHSAVRVCLGDEASEVRRTASQCLARLSVVTSSSTSLRTCVKTRRNSVRKDASGSKKTMQKQHNDERRMMEDRVCHMQREIIERFECKEFQQELCHARETRNFTQKRLELVSKVQTSVLPKYGYVSDLESATKMVRLARPFADNPFIKFNTKRIERLIGLA